MVKKKLINEALQQMTGFRIGADGAQIKELASSMGLTKEEWEHIKKHENHGHLTQIDIDDLNDYFAVYTKDTKWSNSDE